jgi:hypothetical protein
LNGCRCGAKTCSSFSAAIGQAPGGEKTGTPRAASKGWARPKRFDISNCSGTMSGRRAKPRVKKTAGRTSRSRPSSTATPSISRALQDLSKALAGSRWYLFGAQAVALHGVPRVTADDDVTVEPTAAGTAPLVKRLVRAGFALQPVGDIDSFVAQTRVLPFVHLATQTSFDVVLSGPGLEEEIHRRVVRRRLGRVDLRVIDVNDLLVLKMLASRPKDLEDVAALVRAAPDGLSRTAVIDRLREFERALDVSDLVQRFESITAAQRP